MRRPSLGGLLIVLALSVPVLVELRTVLVWLGLDVPIAIYVPAAILLVVIVGAAVWVIGEESGNLYRA